ncbi:hypothetical protein [Brevibacterium picturae]
MIDQYRHLALAVPKEPEDRRGCSPFGADADVVCRFVVGVVCRFVGVVCRFVGVIPRVVDFDGAFANVVRFLGSGRLVVGEVVDSVVSALMVRLSPASAVAGEARRTRRHRRLRG